MLLLGSHAIADPIRKRIKTITAYNGTKHACSERIFRAFGVPMLFSNLKSSWQKGAVENVNGLIRKYISKFPMFGHVSNQKAQKAVFNVKRKMKFSKFLFHKFAFTKRLRIFASGYY